MIEDKITNVLCSMFNCNIDYDKLKFIVNDYAKYEEDNPNIKVSNYPTVNHLITNQSKRQNDFKELVDECLEETLSVRYGLIEIDDKVFVIELKLQEFEDMHLMGEYYKNFIL